jgi:hypothetical protein
LLDEEAPESPARKQSCEPSQHRQSAGSSASIRSAASTLFRTTIAAADQRRELPLLFGTSAAAVPVLLDADLVGLQTEAGELGPLAQTALQLGEAGETCQPDDVIPQLAGMGLVGQTADHRTEERGALGRLELDDRSADILARQTQGLVGLPA